MTTETKIFYDKTAHLYDERYNNPTAKYMRSYEEKIIKKYSGGRTIDIGCGTGQHLTLLNDVVGFDISSKMLEEADKKSEAPLVQGKAEQIPFKNNSFDTVICMFTVLNLAEYEIAVKEMNRILKLGGVAIASVVSRWKEQSSLLENLSKEREEKITTVRIEGFRLRSNVITRKRFIHLFKSNGFDVIKNIDLFKWQKPYWGWKREFTKIEKLKLKIDRLLPAKTARLHMAVFKKI
ncbi:MAG: class I SAM-dependent methyltransferase [Candidatus Aenigmarchaeota archaeon]|nr:class I SAM-dependent methyltransferase [Candidatus Aenigmarchaeota archaeon]